MEQKDVKCGICNKQTENTYAKSCCKCEKWYHMKCINMNRTLLNFYEKDLKITGGKRWFCKTCIENVAKRVSIGTPRSSNKGEIILTDIMQEHEAEV